MTEDSIDDILNGKAPSATRKVDTKRNYVGKIWNAVKRPIKALLFVSAVGTAGLYIGVSHSEHIRNTLYSIEKRYSLDSAPDYKTLLERFRKVNALFERYGEAAMADEGRLMFCRELDLQQRYVCKRF